MAMYANSMTTNGQMKSTLNTADKIRTLSRSKLVDLIGTIGDKRTVLAEGDTGSGKSAIRHDLAKRFPDHHVVYLDCTTLDLIDLSIPDIQTHDGDTIGENGIKVVQMRPSANFGLQYGKPLIIMVDEYGKASPPVRNALLKMILEREIGNIPLPEGSIVFVTTNLGAEGLGDILLPHQRNRTICVRQSKPTAEEWVEDFAIPAGCHPMSIAFCLETPQVFESFTNVVDPKDNPYIYHPAEQREAFVTHRAMEAASDLLHAHDADPEALDVPTLQAALAGTLGVRAALDMMAYVKLNDQLPKWQDVMDNPETAIVPTSPTASSLMAFKALTQIEKGMMTPWTKYMMRLNKETQSLFANGVRKKGMDVQKQKLCFSNREFVKWVEANQHIFTADRV